MIDPRVGTSMAGMDDPFRRAQPKDGHRNLRVSRYKNWSLQRKLAELSAQVEATVLEVRMAIPVHRSIISAAQRQTHEG
jgi:hypothetical protein